MFLVTTVLGVTGLWIAILADTGATVLVTLNALRLLGFTPERDDGPAGLATLSVPGPLALAAVPRLAVLDSLWLRIRWSG